MDIRGFLTILLKIICVKTLGWILNSLEKLGNVRGIL